MEENKGQILLYQTPNGESRIEVTLQGETVWLSLDQMAELFQRNKSTISRHIKNVFVPNEFKEPLAQNRLLIISVSNAIRQSKVTAMARNRYVCEMADRILFVGVTEQSSLYPYKNEYSNKCGSQHFC